MDNFNKIEIKRFGLALSLAATIILLKMSKGESPFLPYLFVLPFILLIFSVFLPQRLYPLYRLMQAIAGALGSLIGWIVLAFIFYLIITPLGLLSRLKRDPLLLGSKKLNSYWIKKEEIFNRENYKRQF